MRNRNGKALIKYQSSLYVRSNRMMMPLLVYIIYLFAAYKVGPVGVISSMALSSGVLYFLMVWIGYSYGTVHNPVGEQLVILKVKSHTKYYVSQLLFVALLALVFSLIGVAFPYVWNLFRSGHLFVRPIVASDILGGFALHSFLALLGVSIGMLFHPRLIKNRKLAILCAFFYAIMGYVKGPIGIATPLVKGVTWVFPPFYDVLIQVTQAEYFTLKAFVIPAILMLVYLGIFSSLYVILLRKRKF